ncbi:hypothetical protein PR003_g32072, partial [Phytophthora rubi]
QRSDGVRPTSRSMALKAPSSSAGASVVCSRATRFRKAGWSSTFSYGVANRGASIRIPRVAEAEGKGYFEDRRPASNMDPYVVTARIIKTTILNEA